jgi:GNAT superfamily N-acetyltransferase
MIIPIRIRKATRGDVATIVEFNAQLAQETEAVSLNKDLARRGVEDVLADSSKGVYWLAEVNGVVIGQLLRTVEWSDWRDGFFWWIRDVFVKREWRGRGVFHTLFDFVQQLAVEHPEVCGVRLCVEAQDARARRLCEALGMEPTRYQVYEMAFRKEGPRPSDEVPPASDQLLRPDESAVCDPV